MIIGLAGKKNSGKGTVCRVIQQLVHFTKLNYPPFDLISFIVDNIKVGYHTESIIYHSDWHNRKFSKKLKQGLELDFPNEFSEELWEISGEDYRDGIMPSLGISRREALKIKGMKHREINPLYWVNALMSEYKATNEQQRMVYEDYKPKFPNWLITDVRFPDDEAKSIKDRGGLIFRVESKAIWHEGKRWTPETGDSSFYNVDGQSYKDRKYWSDFPALDTHPSETAMDDYLCYNGVIDNTYGIEDTLDQVKTLLEQFKII